jgi:putative transposase
VALYLDRQVEPHRARNATWFTLVLLSRLFMWREALTIIKTDTFIRWSRKGFRLFGRWELKPRGRSRAPADLQKLIVEMAHENPTRGEERIAAELLLKLGIRVSRRTVRRYVPDDKGNERRKE